MVKLRKILFFSFAGIYIIGCPLLLMYGSGDLFRPGQREGRGEIYLATAPRGATVYLGDKKYTHKTPASLRGIVAGISEITLDLKGYRLWQRRLKAIPGRKLVLDKILLIPDRWKEEKISPEFFQGLIPVATSDFFIVKKGPLLKDYYVYDCQEQILKPVIQGNYLLMGLKVVSCFTVPGSSAVVIQAEHLEQKKFLGVKVVRGNVRVKDITELFPEDPATVIWDPADSGRMFSFQSDYINRLDLATGMLYPRYLERIRGYGIFNKKIYSILDTTDFVRIDYNRVGKEILIQDPIMGRFIFGQKGFVKVRPLTEEIILFLREGGQLFGNVPPHRFIPGGVRGIKFHRPSRRVLYWVKGNIGIIDFKEELFRVPDQEKLLEIFWIYGEGRDIGQAFWVYQGSHVLVRDVDSVFLFEIIRNIRPAPVNIVKVYKGTSVHYSENTGKLYYLGERTGELYCLKVVPHGI